jgi:hypothetical protein
VTEDIGKPLAQIEYREIRKQQRADPLNGEELQLITTCQIKKQCHTKKIST